MYILWSPYSLYIEVPNLSIPELWDFSFFLFILVYSTIKGKKDTMPPLRMKKFIKKRTGGLWR